MTTLYKECATPEDAVQLFIPNREPVELWVSSEFGCVSFRLDTAKSVDRVVISDVQGMPFPLLNELLTKIQAETLNSLFIGLSMADGIDFKLESSGFNHAANTMVFHQPEEGLYLSFCRNPLAMVS